MDNSAALRLIFSKKKKKKLYFSVLRSCSPCILILMMSFCCVDVKKKGPMFFFWDGACSLMWAQLSVWKKKKRFGLFPRQALQQCFSFFLVFIFFSDNFDFKILINYSKAFQWDLFFFIFSLTHLPSCRCHTGWSVMPLMRCVSLMFSA